MDCPMPEDVRHAIKTLAGKEKTCFDSSRESETSISLLFDVADHPEPDCKYVSQLLFDWDIPEPGRLLCYVSIGIWNPPAPEDGNHMTPFIDIGPSDEDAFHPMILRHVAVPDEIANLAKSDMDRFVESLIVEIKSMVPAFGENQFDDTKSPKGLVSSAFSGLIRSGKDYLQWSEWIDQDKDGV